MSLNYIKLGQWMNENGFYTNSRLKNKKAIFDYVLRTIKDKKVLYLEFGVFKGKTTNYWANQLTNKNSVLHGFDSFEGLPESWDKINKKGCASAEGNIPKIKDKRVKFFKGWFNEVLPNYSIPNSKNFDVTILILDADLYSSTSFVLRHFRDYIKKGFLLYFDDMNRPEHEPKAFSELIESTGLDFKLIATDRSFNRCCFECIG